MTLRIDLEGFEIEALEALTDWPGKRVLEIGCGEGRLTQRLARLGAHVDAVDPEARLIAKARKALPKRLAKRVHFRTGKAERLGYRDGWFDAVVFAWAL